MANTKTEIIISAKDETRQAIDGIKSSLNSLSGFASKLLAGFGGAFSVDGMVDFGKAAINAAREAEQANLRVQATLKATGNAAGLVAEDIDRIAQSMAATTQFDDDAARTAAANFLKFGNIQSDVFERGLQLSADLAAFMGTELPEAAQQLGRSLADPEEGFGRLARSLGGLTKAQEESIKAAVENGDTLKAQGIILDLVQDKIGGTAELLNTGLNKAVHDSTKSWGEFLETIGKTPAVQAAATAALKLLSPNKITNDLLDPNFQGVAIGPDAKLPTGFQPAPTINDSEFLKGQAKGAEAFAKLNQQNEAENKKQAEAAKNVLKDIQALSDQKLAFFRRDMEELARMTTTFQDAARGSETVSERLQRQLDSYGSYKTVVASVNGELRQHQELITNLDPEYHAHLQSLIDITKAQEALKISLEGYNRQQELNADFDARDLAIQDELLDADERRTLELEQQAKAVLQSLDPMQKLYEEQSKLASLNMLGLISDEELNAANKKLLESVESAQNGFASLKRAIEGFGKESARAIADFAFGAEADFSKMVESMLKDLAQLALYKGVTEPLFQGAGKFFEGLSLFGGPKADGGPVDPSKFYLVGERGPELFVPSASGTIIPNDFATGGGDQYVTINVDATGTKTQGDADLAKSLGRRLEGAVKAVLLDERRAGGLLAR